MGLLVYPFYTNFASPMSEGKKDTVKTRIISTAFIVLALAVFKPFGLKAWQWMGVAHLLAIFVLGILSCMTTEGILKYAEIFDINMSEMLLLANGCELPQDYHSVRKDLQSVLLRILPYCSNELEDMAKLLRASEEENEPTKTINRQLLKDATNIIKNFGQVLQLLFFRIEHAYKSFEELNDARIKSLYESQYMRYCNDNVQMLQEYADEIDDVNEAKKELKEMFSLPSLHSIYKRNIGKPHLLIREMRQQCMFENHLIEIFAYRAKMEKIKDMKPREPEPKIVVNIGDRVENKTVIPHVDNFKPHIDTQNITLPDMSGTKLLKDE